MLLGGKASARRRRGLAVVRKHFENHRPAEPQRTRTLRPIGNHFLGQDLENPDAKTIERHAHTLKSSAATLGAMGLRDQCRDLEDAASIGNLGGAAERIQAIQDEYATVSRELQAILDGE